LINEPSCVKGCVGERYPPPCVHATHRADRLNFS
jgi:hypothetical protein